MESSAEQYKDKGPNFLSNRQKKIIGEPIDESLIYSFEGNSYVGHQVITELLNKTFDYAWSWKIIDKGIEEAREYAKKNKNNYNNNDNNSETSKPKTYYAWVLGELTYPVYDDKADRYVWISKQSFGGKQIVGNAKVQSQNFKSASSDALKKAASLIGFAKNVYMSPEMYKAILDEEIGKDSWNNENVNYYKDEIVFMNTIKSKFGEDKFNSIIKQYCDETDYYTVYGSITPSNITEFIEWYKTTDYSKTEDITLGDKINALF